MAHDPPVIDPQKANAVAVLTDPKKYVALRLVLKRLSVTLEEIAIELEMSHAKVGKVLDCLIEKGLVTRSDPERGGLPLYSPTSMGVRAYKGVTEM